MKKELTGLVLAGGLSSRMGQDKADLSIDGIVMLERAKSLLKQVGCQQVLVSRNQVGDDYIQDVYPQTGPLAGIHAAIDHFEGMPMANLLVIPVDMPLLSESCLSRLVDCGFDQNQACYYHHFPLPAFIPAPDAHFEYLEHVLTDSEANNSIKAFLRECVAQAISTEAPEKLINTNTPADWQLLQAELCAAGITN
ncbi:molybdenum cofactor guanylyltransferase [Catenovulum sp. SM1970]|uniref:molybdenum cofactor guanylyltransferase n=1 Tax=Marinifaba aquimaris TaxID=2741323 RepID=UPI001572F84D|nr:molybdenum cofactor guanylyltransferase [Marinifaba aquimaris]NTS76208.1 molybdenum cofactor guanylyltransferase [Marinifaba aquimaris]